MPKVIQPRRHDKSLSAEQFWEIRNQQKAPSVLLAVPAYREEEIASRYRFQRPSEQAKSFNPLAYFYRTHRTHSDNELHRMVEEDEDTYIGTYLTKNQGQVSPPLTDLKRWAAGRSNILHNQMKILALLISNLHTEDAWPLLQALLKDCRGAHIDAWIDFAFKQIAQAASSLTGTTFNQTLFSHLFDTLCVLMQTSFSSIADRLQPFFISFATAFLKHQNKYIRQFSLQAFSYILSNLPDQIYTNFLNTLNKLQSQGFFDSLVSLASLLVQRLIFSKGCLTAASLGIFLGQLESFKDILNAVSSEFTSDVVCDYIFLVLKQLNTKGGGNSESILFDLNHILSSLLKLAAVHPQLYRPSLARALSKFVSLYQAEPKRFEPKTEREERFLKATWATLSGFYQESTEYLTACDQLNVALAVISTKGQDCLLYNKSIINYYKNNARAVTFLIRFLHDQQASLSNNLIHIVLLLSRDVLTQFFQRSFNEDQIDTLYSLIIILKRSSFPHLIESSYLGLTPLLIQAKIKSCQSRNEFFLILRLLTYIKCERSSDMASFLLKARESTLSEYESFFSSLSQQSKVSEWIAQNPLPQQFYEWRRFAKQIVAYSHHQIPWMREAFNFLQAYNLLFQHLHNTQGLALPQLNSTWNHLLVNRPSAVRILGNSLQEPQEFTLPFISSRNREVRLISLQLFKRKIFKDNSEQVVGESSSEEQKLSLILSLLLQIDQEQISLENQREVKRSFCHLEEAINCFEGQFSFRKIAVFQHTLHWSLGFAFTGFKLIHQAFISFFSKLISYTLVRNAGISVVAEGLLPFLCYYNYRHSRQHDFDIAEDSFHLSNLFKPAFSGRMVELMQEDLEIKDLQTVEWIGLERIAEAIHCSPRAKQNMSSCLFSLVSSYFSVQFTRQQRLIKESQLPSQSPLLLPVKSRFLATLLKLCPRDFMPPAECLHFVRDEYFEVWRVREIKKHPWQGLWQKEKQGGKGDKNQRTKISVNLSHLSPAEQELYLHYLWKELLEVNHHKKRSTLQHIRNQLNEAAPRIIQILFNSLCLDDISQSPDTVSIAARRLQLLNRKVLLTHMFILKSILTHLRSLVTETKTLQMVFMFILALIQVAYSPKEPSPLLDRPPENELMEEEQQEPDQLNEGGELQDQEQSQTRLYKQHRKELQKLLETLFANHTLPTDTVSQLIGFLLQKTRINLCKATRSSVPGLLHILLVLSQQKQYCEVIIKVGEGCIIQMLAEMMGRDSSGVAPLSSCQSIWLKIFENIMLPQKEQTQSEARSCDHQLRINELIQSHTTTLVEAILKALTIPAPEAVRKNQKQSSSNQQTRFLTVADLLMQLPGCVLGQGWSSYLWNELNAVVKNKGKMGSWQHQKLSLLLRIIGRFLQSQPELQGQFLQKIVLLLPYLKDLQHREEIIQIITKKHIQLGLRQSVVQLVLKMGSLKRVGLQITLNFNSFFQASSEYASLAGSLSAIEHEYFLHHLLSFADHEELPLRKAVHQSIKSFLQQTTSRLDTSLLSQGKMCSEILVKLFRVLLDFIQKAQVQQNQSIFWSIIDDIEIIFSWLAKNAILLRPLFSDCLNFYALLAHSKDEADYLRLLVSISQSNKLKALKQLKNVIQNFSEAQCKDIREWKQGSFDLPNPLHRLILPVLLYFISRPHAKQDQQSKSNLSSSLALNSLELLPLVSSILKPNLLRSELKRLVSKLKFSEAHSKSNLSTIKVIGQLLEGVPGDTATSQLHQFIHQHGFQQFHQRLVQHHQVASEPEDQEEDEAERILGKPKMPDYYDHLEELEQEQAIRRNFLSFDKKLMQFEQEQPEEDEFCAFLKRHILPPLRTLLMVQSRAKEEEDTSRAKILLSVTTIKVILRLPLETFLREFQKVIAKLSRLLKKREAEVRQYARRCLCEITKTVGTQLLYSVITTMQFHLKDNFDRHVFNYTVYRILEEMVIKPGDIDYCLPLLLPMVMDEVYGRTSSQKEMVARAQAPTLKAEAKKKKGFELLQLLFKHLSHAQVNFVVDFLQKYLCQHLISEQNMGKYDQILGSLSSGLAVNQDVMNPTHSSILLKALYSPVSSLRQHLKWLSQQGNNSHQRLTGRQWGRKKVGKEETLTLQEEAGRNRSIFARLNIEIAQKKNNQIVTSALVQFYLTVMSLLVRKQVLTLNSAASVSQAEQLMTLIAFLVDCIDHRDNRLVSKSLKILHFTLSWKVDCSPSFVADKMRSLRKQANRKVLGLAERLTLSDQELLKECFVFLNDLIGEAAVNVQMLPSLVALIKLHTPTTEDQPHIPQTYKLLRTIVYKSSQYIYNPLLQDLQKMVKLQVATSINRQIRQISKNILSVYLKEKAELMPGIEAFNLEAKRHGWPSISYGSLVKDELRFYLSNLQGAGQSTIIELLGEWASHRSRDELEEYSELLILSAMTARTNQLAQQAELNSQFLGQAHLVDPLIQSILDRIDQSKLNGFIDKSILWMKSPRSTSIRLCGASLFTLVLVQLSKTQRISRLNQQQITGSKGCLSPIATILSQETNAYEQYSAFEKTHARIDSKWNEIMSKMEKESMPYQCDLSVFQALRQLRILSEVNYFKKEIDGAILSPVWRLLRHSNPKLVQEALKVCHSYKMLLVVNGIMERADGQTPSEYYCPKQVISKLLFSAVPTEQIQTLLFNLLLQELAVDQNKVLKSVAQLLIGLSLKAHIKPKAFEATLPKVLTLLNHVLLNNDANGSSIRSILCRDDQSSSKLVELTLKLISNQLIDYQSKALVQSTAEILKQELGNEKYFRLVSAFEEGRQERRTRQKIHKAEMTMLDPQALAGEKKLKKRKIQ